MKTRDKILSYLIFNIATIEPSDAALLIWQDGEVFILVPGDPMIKPSHKLIVQAKKGQEGWDFLFNFLAIQKITPF